MFLSLHIGLLVAVEAYAQISVLTLSGSNTRSVPNLGGDLVPTGTEATYASYASTITVSSSTAASSVNGSMSLLSSSIAGSNASTATSSTTSRTVTILTGSHGASSTASLNATTAQNVTATQTTSMAPQPTNTQPCNQYPEFCTRKYSNITYVAAHNSPFTNPNNAAANQQLSVTQQLDDGIRMLQGQTHLVGNTLYYCHTSCDLLNAGTAQSYFANITSWVKAHPYDVVTVLIGNGDYIGVGNFTSPLESSGLAAYAYTPPKIPMSLSDWPTLSEMILTNKRVVIFLDYDANQSLVPYIQDEFSQLWETPFDPTNQSFPCTVQRPPGISRNQSEERMYMLNHNLNTEISLLGTSLLVPNFPALSVTNNVSGFGSLGLSANQCTEEWSRPPNFLLVDYYNVDNGTVFEVAAQHNNVTYTRKCCGLVQSSASLPWDGMRGFSVVVVAAAMGLGLIG
ncbi:PLC-like phosphodiesterase, TIM beta/alpha-barrel domain [Lasallia pustulata]|uniref:PLC-like phosphodiesterase, TIM beta/alpha-barrel domain n=1 Tax=Lasallia pustulata TaxID=136370 RepID=A0A1W5DCN9_9LECA|nr:PLC-like phosphodiesterase, TIM beta/alpha-barrel domain [Lasallia pustulata]